MKIREIEEKRQKVYRDLEAINKLTERENRDYTDTERQTAIDYLKEVDDLDVQLKAANDQEALIKKINALGAEFDQAAKENGGQGQPGQAKGTIGEQFVNSPVFQNWFKQVAPGGSIPESMKNFQSPPVEFGSFLGRKTLITGDSVTSAGAFVQTDYSGIYEPLGRQPIEVVNLLSRRQTRSDLIEFMRQTAIVQQAAMVAEANVTTYTGATGQVEGLKPEGTMAFEKVTTTVKTMAVTIPATNRALADASQMRGIIDQELRADLAEELEDQILNGNGAGENFTGILATPNVLTQAWDTDLLTTLRKARTYLRVTGRTAPNAILMHPNDIETVDLLKDLDGRFYYGGPAVGGVPGIWRVPVIECQTMTEGQALMGDFRKAVLWDREQATLRVAQEHSDFFARNMVLFLAEMRVAFAVIRPSAFVIIDLTSGS